MSTIPEVRKAIITPETQRRITKIRTTGLRELFDEIFNDFVDKEYITGFNCTLLSRGETSHQLILKYECQMSLIKQSTEPYCTKFVFIQHMDDKVSEVSEVESNALRSKIVIPNNCNYKIVESKIKNRLKGWRSGRDNEYLLECFLEDFKNNNHRILDWYKNGQHDDVVNGVDYTVRYYAKPDWNVVTVPFNVKLSANFLEKHKEKHPTISTFGFKKEDLWTLKQTYLRFARFLLDAPKQKEAIHR